MSHNSTAPLVLETKTIGLETNLMKSISSQVEGDNKYSANCNHMNFLNFALLLFPPGWNHTPAAAAAAQALCSFTGIWFLENTHTSANLFYFLYFYSFWLSVSVFQGSICWRGLQDPTQTQQGWEDLIDGEYCENINTRATVAVYSMQWVNL